MALINGPDGFGKFEQIIRNVFNFVENLDNVENAGRHNSERIIRETVDQTTGLVTYERSFKEVYDPKKRDEARAQFPRILSETIQSYIKLLSDQGLFTSLEIDENGLKDGNKDEKEEKRPEPSSYSKILKSVFTPSDPKDPIHKLSAELGIPVEELTKQIQQFAKRTKEEKEKIVKEVLQFVDGVDTEKIIVAAKAYLTEPGLSQEDVNQKLENLIKKFGSFDHFIDAVRAENQKVEKENLKLQIHKEKQTLMDTLKAKHQEGKLNFTNYNQVIEEAIRELNDNDDKKVAQYLERHGKIKEIQAYLLKLLTSGNS